ncbi:MAG TPA: M20/M25/M40 family metallo-hydrolase [Bacteriovoracaceae bacterium]|nr:M20/M25/M40 family metallo-hydrolase [Bacteriovoracaceae bacterium]
MKTLSVILILLAFLAEAFAATTSAQRLQTLVDINSGSENVNGVNKVQETYKGWLLELGFSVELVSNPSGENTSGKLLVATLAGEGPKFVTMVMHADTVFEPVSKFQKFVKLGELKAHGPGVIDNKGGMVVTILALKEYLEKNKKPKHSLRVVVSPNEELGSPGFKEIFEKISYDSFMVLGVEPAHELGVVHSRKGNLWVEISVQGKEAHAGRHHKDGINACHILAEKIAQIQKLTDYKREVTVSIGRMEGGQDKFNIVCGSAKAKLDVRTPSLDHRMRMKQKVEALLKAPEISYKIIDDTAPFKANKESLKVVNTYLETIKEVEGIVATGHASGGTGDTNYFSREGVIIIDGLGPIGEEIHTENEFIQLPSLDSRARVLSSFLGKI